MPAVTGVSCPAAASRRLRLWGVSAYTMPSEAVHQLVAACEAHQVAVCIGGGWAVDALVGRQTRHHADLDVWVSAGETEGLFAALTEQGVDRIHPWPGDRPWNFVLHDGRSRRVDLHLYEPIGDGRLHYGSVTAPFDFARQDLSGQGEIAGVTVRCERPEFALRNHAGYEPRAVDRDDVAVLCRHFGLDPPPNYG
jgi:lincosamide nucleotidyltransferase A/C/D/E